MPNRTLDPSTELKRAREYFDAHEDEVKLRKEDSGFSASYFRESNGTVFKITESPHHVFGKGASGFVKRAEGDTVVKVQLITSERALKKARQEASINVLLGLATSELIERKLYDEAGNAYWKVYQRMHHRGNKLTHILEEEQQSEASNSPLLPQDSMRRDIDRAIALCLQVDKVHANKIAHKDVKPDNILIKDGEVSLVDFGSASRSLDDDETLQWEGTPLYAPVDMSFIKEGEILMGMMALQDELMDAGLEPEISNAVQDRIGLLRVLSYPQGILDRTPASVLSSSTCAQLPACLVQLFDTTTVLPHLSEPRRVETPRFFAAVMIAYKHNGYRITQDEIDSLRADPAQQEVLIRQEELNQKTSPVSLGLGSSFSKEILSESMMSSPNSPNAPVNKQAPMHSDIASEDNLSSLTDHRKGRFKTLPVSTVNIGRSVSSMYDVSAKPPIAHFPMKKRAEVAQGKREGNIPIQHPLKAALAFAREAGKHENQAPDLLVVGKRIGPKK